MFIPLNNAIIPALLPQTAPVAVTGWNSNWVIGGLLGVGLLLGWVATGYGKKRAAARKTRAKKLRISGKARRKR